jgi:glycosyltransferase involved in cell wall biosynthesis
VKNGSRRLNIVLVTSGQPSLNPRLVKEADALAEAGHHVTVLYQYWNQLGTEMDESLLRNAAWKAVRVGGIPGDLMYLCTRALHKAGRWLAAAVSLRFAEWAIGRCTLLLSAKAKQCPANLYIAHHLAALPAAAAAAKKYGVPYAFDAEDLHRFEISDDPTSFRVRLNARIEEKYLPLTAWRTASSPGIAAAYQRLFPALDFKAILNVFSTDDVAFRENEAHERPLKLFWFSQVVGLSRGIQDVIRAMKLAEPACRPELHVLGTLSSPVETALRRLIGQLQFQHTPVIVFHLPVAPHRLVSFASAFDIGLAAEPGFSPNNELALSNKLFTYIHAGLAVLASDTPGQAAFMARYPPVGRTYHRSDPASLCRAILGYHTNRTALAAARRAAYRLGRETLNWETERRKFLSLVDRFTPEQGS